MNHATVDSDFFPFVLQTTSNYHTKTENTTQYHSSSKIDHSTHINRHQVVPHFVLISYQKFSRKFFHYIVKHLLKQTETIVNFFPFPQPNHQSHKRLAHELSQCLCKTRYT